MLIIDITLTPLRSVLNPKQDFNMILVVAENNENELTRRTVQCEKLRIKTRLL